MLWIAAALNVAALFAAHGIARAGRAPARWIGFVRVLVITSIGVGFAGWWSLGGALERVAALDPARKSAALAAAVEGAYALIFLSVLIPAASLLATAWFGATRKPPVPPAKVVSGGD